jgi:hypothetical protein
MDRQEFENFMSVFIWTSIFESWDSYARVSGNASLEDEKNKFGSFQLTYPDATTILAAPHFPAFLAGLMASPDPPPLPPPRTPRTIILSSSRAVCMHMDCLGF